MKKIGADRHQVPEESESIVLEESTELASGDIVAAAQRLQLGATRREKFKRENHCSEEHVGIH